MKTLRFLDRHRRFWLTGASILACAVGLSTLLFSVANAIWLRPRPIFEPSRLVIVARDRSTPDGSRFSIAGVNRLRENAAFQDVAGQLLTTGRPYAAYRSNLVVSALSGAGRSAEVAGVTPNYFQVLGVNLLGQFSDGVDSVWPDVPAVISHKLWQDAFGGRSNLLGQSVDVNPFRLIIVGIAPPGFQGARLGENLDVWLPFSALVRRVLADSVELAPTPMVAFARLRPGATIDHVQAWFAASGQGPYEILPIGDVFGAADVPMTVPQADGALGLLAAGGGLVMIVACVSLFALALVHFGARRREFAIRLVLGAGRGRLVRRLVIEYIGLGAFGGTGAIFLASLGAGLLPSGAAVSGVDLGRIGISPDWRVALFSVTACILTVVVGAGIALADVLRSRPLSMTGHLAAHQRTSRSHRIGLALQAAATAIALVAAGTMAQWLYTSTHFHPGFEVQRALFVHLELPVLVRARDEVAKDQLAARRVSSAAELLEQVRAIRGVERVALGGAPVGPSFDPRRWSLRVLRFDAEEQELPVAWLSVGPEYLETLGAPAVIGGDTSTPGPADAVVTSSLARKLWGNESPIGRHLVTDVFDGKVIGVVDLDVGSVTWGGTFGLMTFGAERVLPLVTRNRGELQFAVRARDPAAVRNQVQGLIRQLFPDAIQLTIATGRETLDADLSRERFLVWFAWAFAGMSLLMALAGVWALVRYVLELRRRDFAIRLALGANSWDLARVVVGNALGPSVAGVLAGLVVGAMSIELLRSIIVGLGSTDILLPLLVGVIVSASVTAAAVLSARRARAISPTEVLRD